MELGSEGDLMLNELVFKFLKRDQAVPIDVHLLEEELGLGGCDVGQDTFKELSQLLLIKFLFREVAIFFP